MIKSRIPISLFYLLVSLSILGPIFLTEDVKAQTGSRLIIEPASANVEVGESGIFDIIFEVEAGRTYGAGTFALTYNSSIVSITAFNLGPGMFGVVNANQPDQILFNALDPLAVGEPLSLEQPNIPL